MKTLSTVIRSRCGAAALACALSAAAIVPGFVGAAEPAKNARPQDLYPLLDLFGACLAIVQSDYVENVNPTNMVYGALHGLMRSLDPHSEFMEAEETEQLKIDTEGEFVGVGMEYGIRDDMLTVISLIEGSPAFKSGLMPNDLIIKVNDESTRDMAVGEVRKRLRGKKGTNVRITVQRILKDRRDIKEFTITRAVIRVVRVRDAGIIDATNGIGYARVTSFDRLTADELQTAVDTMSTQGLQALVIDLRNNGGGLLNEAIDLASMFLETNQLVVSTRGRIETQNQVYYAVEEGPKYRMPLVILVNGGSASASEIVCGAVKDNQRGVIVGSRTFGKGSVQTVLPIGNNTSLRLTTAKYYTPSGVCIHGTGIFPTVEVKISIDDEIKLIERRSTAHLNVKLDSLTKDERAKYDELNAFRDVQLDRALDVLAAMRFMSGSPFTKFTNAPMPAASADMRKPTGPTTTNAPAPGTTSTNAP